MWNRFEKHPGKRFKVEIKLPPQRRHSRNLIRSTLFSSHLQGILNAADQKEENSFSVEFLDALSPANNFFQQIEDRKLIRVIKDICKHTHVAALHLRDENEWVKKIATAKVMHCAKEEIRCFDFSNQYKNLIKAVKTNRR